MPFVTEEQEKEEYLQQNPNCTESINRRLGKLNQFVGQKDLIKRLKIEVEASIKENRPICHQLWAGAPGTGKSTLPPLLAQARGVDTIWLMGPSIDEHTLSHVYGAQNPDDDNVVSEQGFCKINDRWQFSGEPTKPTIIVVDECELIPTSVFETWYTILEPTCGKLGGVYQAKVKGNSKPVNAWVPPHTSIFLTNKMGEIWNKAPGLRRRCRIVHTTTPYKSDELSLIAKQFIEKQGYQIDDNACKVIGSRSHGIPGYTIQYSREAISVHSVRGNGTNQLTTDDIKSAFEVMGIDHLGLNPFHQRIMDALYEAENNTLSLDAIEAITGEDVSAIKQEAEPLLMRLGLINRTGQGRKLTMKGQKHVENKQNPDLTQSRIVS